MTASWLPCASPASSVCSDTGTKGLSTRLSVFTLSPGAIGISDGTITSQRTCSDPSNRASSYPVGPAS